MDFIRPIGPIDRDIDPIRRVEPAHDEEREQPEQRERKRRQEPDEPVQEPAADGPVEGDDGHLHIDVRA